ncbi:MAG: response regulator [Gallionella sp.]|nr:response regulator [Gallionella sp.]
MPKLLLVEDNEMNRDMLSRRLERKGFEVVMAVDGGEGVAMAFAEQPDLILMDMNLPVLDGWEATRRIKAAPQTAVIPVIGLTAHAMSGDREKGMAAGCDDYDTKPVDFNRLFGKINALLKIEPDERHAAAEVCRGKQVGSSAASNSAATDKQNQIQIDGLDYATGLSRTGGDEKFYRQLLARFVANFTNAPADFSVWIANANWVEAERQAHTLKGLAGSLGINALISPATDLEQCCKAGQREQAAAVMARLVPLLTVLLEQLNVLLRVPEAAQGEASLSPGTLTDCLPKLRKLLAESDPAAAGVWAEHQAAFAALIPSQTVHRITAAIEQFDLDVALALLAELPVEAPTATPVK